MPADFSANPNSKREKQARALWSLFKVAQSNRSEIDRNWDKYFRFHKGDQWPNDLPQWKAAPVFNKINSTIETIVSLITDQPPEPVILPVTEDDEPLVDTIQNLYDKIVEENHMPDVNQKVARGAEVYGTYYFHVWFDVDANDGEGQIKIRAQSCRNVFPAPNYTDIDDDDSPIPWLIVARAIDRHELAKIADEKIDIDKIQPGVLIDGITNDFKARQFPHDEDERSTLFTSKPNTDGLGEIDNFRLFGKEDGTSEILGRSTKLYTHIELWVNDETVDENGERMFPSGRLLDWVNGVIVRDIDNPMGFIPYVKYNAQELPEKFHGQGTVETILDSQKTLNKIYGIILDNAALTLNPPFVYDDNAIDASLVGKFFNYPGASIPKRPGSQMNWLATPDTHPSLFSLVGISENVIDTVTGIFDVTQGRRPANVESAQGIALVQSASQTRIRQKTRNLNIAQHKVFVRIARLVKKFFTEEKILRVHDGGKEVSFKKINEVMAETDRFEQQVPGEIADNAVRVTQGPALFGEFNENDNFVMPNGDVVKPVPDRDIIRWVRNPVFSVDWDVFIQPGSGLPLEQRIRSQEAFRLFETQAIDDVGLLEALQWPKRHSILERQGKMKELQGQVDQLTQLIQELAQQIQQPSAQSGTAGNIGPSSPEGVFSGAPGGQDLTTLNPTPQPLEV